MNDSIAHLVARDRRAIISSLWVFVFLNMLFRDIHEIFRPGAIAEYEALVVSEVVFLAAGVGLTLFISMIVLVRILPRRGARIVNLVTPVLAVAAMAGSDVNDLDDAWFLAVEVVGLLAIMLIAWTWKSAPAVPGAAVDVGDTTVAPG